MPLLATNRSDLLTGSGFINGEALLELISLVEGAPRHAIESGAPSCPVCQRSMVKKKGRKGGTIGSLFWRCTAYPRCMGVRAV